MRTWAILAYLFFSLNSFASTEAFIPQGLELSPEAFQEGQKVLIGEEGREEADTSKYPYTAIGLIKFKTSEGFGACSGALVSKNVVLTNGHCVWDLKNKKFYEEHTFEPGLQMLSSKLGEIKVKSVHVSVSYQEGTAGIDFGFLVLEENIGQQTGWLGVKNWEVSWLWQDRFYVSGYGTNYLGGFEFLDYQTVNKSPCEVSRFKNWGRTMVHNCDTGPGSSGSPLFHYVNGKPYIVGVHFGGSGRANPREGCGSWLENWMPGSCENYATRSSRFLPAMVKIIEEQK